MLIYTFSSLRAVQRLMAEHTTRTTRRSALTDVEKGAAILKLVEEEDPLGRWGVRLIKEKLASKGIHVSR